ncbi:monovalent cation/H(+) antiporter subunit G [Roseomonas sp. OT10]|uniref:monovalent cation/H(+) antiporter subunit G n=1 Tax=Roseomonas cutis TaxID=2897332 RepID=UPI001E57E7C9|nr:monovalent cation/H(+) antiporter subunit G [Roseomonas sp. OT10]UFN47920.1 monovalent cation/H(+) antiporter subunit G [Roseomonas sp. OT10]
MIRDLLGIALVLAGVAFLAIAALGVVRLPDAFQRMHAATKAGTLGSTLLLLGVMLAEGSGGTAVSGGLTILLMLVTLPVSAQLLGRAAYMSGATLVGLGESDPLAGILSRRKAPLEDRIRREE